MLKPLFTALAACAALAPAIRADVIINEIHYDPDVKTQLVEFIELHNTSASPANISGWSFNSGIQYTFPPNTSIPGNGYLVVTQNPTQFQAKFGRAALGPWSGGLSNEGENISLRDAEGNNVDSVDYGAGFPWPTVGEPPGYSIELANPTFDNDIGGNWRGSVVLPAETVTLLPTGSTWKYFKGQSEPSSPATAWRILNFDDSAWSSGAMPIGYDPSVAMRTRLDDMPGNYTSVYFRKIINVEDPARFNTVQLQAMYDDGFKIWINGQLVAFPNMPSSETPYTATSTGGARESSAYDTIALPSPPTYLVPGQNIIAIQAHNTLLSGSSDFYVDLRLLGLQTQGSGSGPTPGARNSTFTDNLPPQIRQVDHTPSQPVGGQPVLITAKVTDPEGVAEVRALYQIVEPGSYIELTDAAYATTWTTIIMNDTGTNGDERAGDSIYTATIPASVQVHRRLIRYRISARDNSNRSVTVPYADDPQPNFAYFCYNGVPAWTGAVNPAGDQTQRVLTTYPAATMNSLPVYHLISKNSSVEASTWIEQYRGDEYKWSGALVYDGKVYDHIHYRARGGVWRYAMGKNMWKLDFNRGHDFRPRDNWGREYNVGWTKLNLGACIQQGDYLHRGEQGMFESVGFRLFNLTGLEAPKTHFAHFRIIDGAAESSQDQYNGDFWGLYLAIEQEDSRFLEEHGLPDSNLYKMEGGTGDLNNQGPTSPTDKSDLNSFLNALRSTQPESWWRANFDTQRYYNYRVIVEGIHHYDIDGDPGKNYFYYFNNLLNKWAVLPWDLDLTWADNMYGGGNEQFKSRVLPIAAFSREYKNRAREIRDLLFNSDQAYQLIDEHAAMIYNPGAPSFVGADRAQWDYNPIMASGYVNPSKSGQGRFYQRAATRDFPGMVQIMKAYVVSRGSLLDGQAADGTLPTRPTIASTSPAGFPANRISFRSSAYAGPSPFFAMQWRIGEVTPAGRPAFDRNNPRAYEIVPIWQSPEITVFNENIQIPSGVLRVGKTYRARVKMKDTQGKWSNWSQPVEFTAGEPDNAVALIENLRITEVMYNPPAGNDFEFIEIFNSSADVTLDLAGARFTSGVDYTFQPGAQLPPRTYALVARGPAANNFSAFRTHYNLPPSIQIFGPFTGGIANEGEEITLRTTTAGAVISSFDYSDSPAWPVAADGAGHSLVALQDNLTQTVKDFSYPGNWRPSAFIKGSPGAADPAPLNGPRLNEIMAHTDLNDPNFPDYDSNDWIEILNDTNADVTWGDWYLSDDPSDLRKWRIPAGTLAIGAFAVFDEITGFHVPITSGFGLDKAGEQVLLSYLPGTAQDRVVDAVRFKGQPNTHSHSRYAAGPRGWRGATPTRGAANATPLSSVIINEVHFNPTRSHPLTDNTADEFVEIFNPTAQPINIFDANGAWRIDGGIDFVFPANTTIAAASPILLVNFDPALSATLNAFRTRNNVPNDVPVYGPYSGLLGNDSDRIALERPEPPDIVGGSFSWIVVDEVVYGNRPQWPVSTDAGGESLNRISNTAAGNDPANWRGASPTPGVAAAPNADTDGDGMSDAWELEHGLDRTSSADAQLDADEDGVSNLAEYQLNSDPRDPASPLRFAEATVSETGAPTFGLYVAANRAYTLERCDNLTDQQWRAIHEITASATPGWREVSDTNPTADTHFYRLKLLP